MELKEIFIYNLKYYRKKENVSQEKLAELTGLHQTYISDIERGIRNPSLKTIEKISIGLHIEAYKLFINNIENTGDK